jgi:hypothetical protein
MSWLLQAASFTIGVYLCIRVLAALYRVIDLWFTIRTAYGRVIGGVLGWGGAAMALVWALHDPYRTAREWGFVGYFLFYLSLFVVRYPLFGLLRRAARQRQRREQNAL